MPKLGVNIDHVATLRQARRESDPDPIAAARIAQKAGAHSIVCHLREDRRHIQDSDIYQIRKIAKRMTLELAISDEILDIACKIKPDHALLVPEKRQELTTEGGLDVNKNFTRVKKAITKLQKKGILVSLFIDPSEKQIRKSKQAGADIVELHTGIYANAKNRSVKNKELQKIKKMAKLSHDIGLIVSAGHGLKYHDTKSIARIKEIEELNIGHSIISRAVFVGLESAVKEMSKLVH